MTNITEEFVHMLDPDTNLQSKPDIDADLAISLSSEEALCFSQLCCLCLISFTLKETEENFVNGLFVLFCVQRAFYYVNICIVVKNL